jgi:hypothetical protein
VDLFIKCLQRETTTENRKQQTVLFSACNILTTTNCVVLYLCAIMLKTLFLLFCLYLLYKLIFEFIIPVYNATTQVRQKVNEMQQKMNEQVPQQNNFTAPPKQSSTEKPKRDDYIDFEEVNKRL